MNLAPVMTAFVNLAPDRSASVKSTLSKTAFVKSAPATKVLNQEDIKTEPAGVRVVQAVAGFGTQERGEQLNQQINREQEMQSEYAEVWGVRSDCTVRQHSAGC